MPYITYLLYAFETEHKEEKIITYSLSQLDVEAHRKRSYAEIAPFHRKGDGELFADTLQKLVTEYMRWRKTLPKGTYVQIISDYVKDHWIDEIGKERVMRLRPLSNIERNTFQSILAAAFAKKTR